MTRHAKNLIYSHSKHLVSYVYLGMGMLVIIACLSGVYRAIWGGTTDFDGFWDAAHTLWDTGVFATGKAIERYPFTFQLYLVPFGALPYACAVILWNILNAVLLIDLPRVFKALSKIPLNQQLLGWLIVLPFALDNLVLCQSGPLLLWLIAMGLVYLQRKLFFKSGCLMGIAALLKILPIVFLFSSILQKRIRNLYFYVGLAIALVLPLVLGLCLLNQPSSSLLEAANGWYKYVLSDGSASGMLEEGIDIRYNNQALPIVLGRTFGNIPIGSAKGVFHIASFQQNTIVWCYRILVIIIVLLWFIAIWETYRSNSPKSELRLFGMTAIVMLAGSPIVWTHYFIWLAPVCIYLSYRKRFSIALLVIAYLGLILIPARSLGIHMLLALTLFFFMSYDSTVDKIQNSEESV